MLQDLFQCDPSTLSLFQPKVLEAIDYIRNINKQRPDVDGIYKHISRAEASNLDKITVANVIDALIDRNVIKNRKTTSGQASYFHPIKKATKSLQDNIRYNNIIYDEKNLTQNYNCVAKYILHDT